MVRAAVLGARKGDPERDGLCWQTSLTLLESFFLRPLLLYLGLLVSGVGGINSGELGWSGA